MHARLRGVSREAGSPGGIVRGGILIVVGGGAPLWVGLLFAAIDRASSQKSRVQPRVLPGDFLFEAQN